MVGVGYRNVLLENMKPNSATVELADHQKVRFIEDVQ